MFIIRILQAGGTWPQVAHSFYLTFSKLFFVVGVSMLATPSLLGIKGDFFFWLMDTKMFNFMAKVSFWTYLIHYMVVEFVCYRQKTDFYFDVGDVFTLYVPVTVIAMFLGFLGTVLVENPFAKL
jgi:peptidoglycan/LPS O-acetylase OafA/YrhL